MSKKSRTGVSIRDGDKRMDVIKEIQEAPIPAAAELEHYEHVLPGAAERLLAIAEKQHAHHLRQDDRITAQNHILAVCGQWIATFLCLCGIGLAAAGLILEYQYAVGFGIVIVVGIIAVGAISRNK